MYLRDMTVVQYIEGRVTPISVFGRAMPNDQKETWLRDDSYPTHLIGMSSKRYTEGDPGGLSSCSSATAANPMTE